MGNLMNANDLHTALTVAQTFTSTDKTIPVICAVRLEFGTDRLIAIATDRFVLGAQRVDYSGEEFAVTMSGDDVKTVARMAKTAARAISHRTVEVEVRRQRVWQAGADHRDDAAGTETGDIRGLTLTFSTGEAITVEVNNVSEFPQWRRLIPAPADYVGHSMGEAITDTATLKGFNAAKLAKFAKVPGHHQIALVVGAANKPSVVTIGDDFIGLIMPVRFPDGKQYARPSWLEA